MKKAETTDIEKWVPIKNMIAQYDRARVEVRQGFELLSKAKSRMKVFGQYRDRIFPDRISDFDLGNYVVLQCYEVMKKGAWEGVIEKSQIRSLMSEVSNKKLSEQLNNVKELPEVTVENIQALLDNLHKNIPNLLIETLRESFEFLRPHYSKHKTNTEFEVGEKVIKQSIFDMHSYGNRLGYYRESEIRSLDNAFHLLDGKGPVRYPGDLLTVIREALSNSLQECDTDYFHLKWYKNGNCHIKFKRMDLVQELNKRAGGDRIKPVN